jgi:hypothetical protein
LKTTLNSSLQEGIGGIERLLQAAYDHGTEGGCDMEADDLQELPQAAWGLLTPEQ